MADLRGLVEVFGSLSDCPPLRTGESIPKGFDFESLILIELAFWVKLALVAPYSIGSAFETPEFGGSGSDSGFVTVGIRPVLV